MSILPQYQKVATEDEHNYSTWKNNDEVQQTTYPPPSSDNAGPSTDHQSTEVIYAFRPRFPVKGKKEDVLGILGRTRQETITMIQRAFPVLADYPNDRISIYIPAINDHGNHDGWNRVIDDTWYILFKDPPKSLRIQVVDDPGDQELRAKRKWGIFLLVMMITCIVIGALAVLIWFIRLAVS